MAPPITTTLASQQQKLPLRRATYAHVSDLTSVYNIDNEQLVIEIARVNAELYKLHKGSCDRTEPKVEPISDKGGTYTDTGKSDEDIKFGTTLVRQAVHQKRLQAPREGFNICVLVGKINLVVDKIRVDRSRVRLAEVEVGDETGTVSLRARDEQIDLLEKVSKCKHGAVVLRNCTLELYQGKHLRLAVTKWGKITEYPDNVASTPGPPPIMNLDRKFSLIDLSLVASEIIAEKNLIKSTSQLQLKHSESQTTTSTSRKPPKPNENESEKASDRTSLSSKASTSRSRQQSHTKYQHQKSQTPRKGGYRSYNERGKSRDTSYGRTQADISNLPTYQSRVTYHNGVQGYHYGHEQHNVNARMQQHYPSSIPYAHSARIQAQQDVVSAQIALQQQYEIQQRQLHHLYTREQNRQSSQAVQRQQQQSHGFTRHINSFEMLPGSAVEPTIPTDLGNLSTSLDRSHTAQTSLSPMSPFLIRNTPNYLPTVQGSSHEQQARSLAYQPTQFSYDLSRLHPPDSSMYPLSQQSEQHHPMFYGQVGDSEPTMYHQTAQTIVNRATNRDSTASTEDSPSQGNEYPRSSKS